MPLPGAPRPAGDTLKALVETMEEVIDRASRPNPGARTFQRLNRSEYERVVRDLLGIEVNAGDFLPLDTKSANFDNIADVQSLSPTLLEAYLNAASAVSRIAIGDRNAPATLVTHNASPFTSQHPWDHIEGAPYGSRGGIVTNHDFPADGLYSFRLNISGGTGTRLEDLDVSVGGERVALLHYEKGVDQNLASADSPAGADYISFHPDASPHVHRSIQAIKAAGCKAGLVFNPGTGLEPLDWAIDDIDLILIMSVNPGFGGQSFIDSALRKIEQARKRIDASGRDIRLEVDGGIKTDNIARVAAAGADTFVAGSAIFNASDYAAVIAAMRQQLASISA